MWWRLLIFGFFMSGTVIVLAFIFGDTIAKAEYEEDYRKLDEAIKAFPEEGYTMDMVGDIERQFTELRRYKCRDDEKIDVLFSQFYQKINL